MKRYWFIVYPEDPFGPKNIGVTAFSKVQALSLAIYCLGKSGLTHYLTNLNDNTEVIENVDLDSLDQNHVIPKIGVVVWKGVWFPNLNYDNL